MRISELCGYHLRELRKNLTKNSKIKTFKTAEIYLMDENMCTYVKTKISSFEKH